MRRKVLLGVSASLLLSLSALAAPLFPNAFEPAVRGGANCSVASDIVPAFCGTSGAGSFSAQVKNCAPAGMTMQGIYYGMLGMYGSLQNACQQNAAKYGGTVQACVGQWTCYWNGGESKDMNGPCDGNGQACASL